MIESIRNFTKSVFSKALIIIIAGSFVFLGIGDMFRSNLNNSYISIGSESYSKAHIEQLTKREEDIYRRNNPKQDENEIANMPFKQIAIQKLIAQNLLEQEAEKIKLVFSNEAILKEVINTEYFKTDGKFDQVKFDDLLFRNGISETEYLNIIREQKIQNTLRQISDIKFSSSFPKTAEVIYNIENQEKIFDLYKVSLAEKDLPIIQDSEVEKFFNNNIEMFTTPEQREINAIKLSCDTVSDQIVINDDEIEEEYNRQTANIIEKRDLQLITFSSQEEAAQALELLKSGKNLTKIAKDLNIEQNLADLSSISKSELFPEFQEAVFNQEEGDHTDIIKGEFGYHIFQITKVHSALKPSLSKLKPEIVAQLQKAQSCSKAAEIFYEIEESVETGLTLKNIAETYQLDLIKNLTINANNPLPLKTKLNLNDQDNFTIFKDIFTLNQQNQIVTKSLNNQEYIIFEIVSSKAKYYPQLVEVRDAVVKKARESKIATILSSKATQYINSVKESSEVVTLPKNFTVERNLKFSENYNRREIIKQREQLLKLTSGYFTSQNFIPETQEITFARLVRTEYPQTFDKVQLNQIQMNISSILQGLISESYSNYLATNHPVNINEKEDE